MKMKMEFGLRSLSMVIILIILVWSSSFDICNAKRGMHLRQRIASTSALLLSKKKGKISGHHHGGASSSHVRPSPPLALSSPVRAPASAPLANGSGSDRSSNMFNVMDFGALGDGATDDTKAFQDAWSAACKGKGSTMVVPSAFVFLLGPISFSGPYCEDHIVFQLDGTIIAPTGAETWGAGLLWWIEFTKLKGITIRGSGVIDGSGSAWWNGQSLMNELSTMPTTKPTALRFYGSFGVTVTGITIQNSPQCHLKFDNCVAVQVYNMSIFSPGDSLNTDGIHLQNSRDVNIHTTNLACGDDCVSIQTGCTNINIQNVKCGPGHGISIGGLGRDNTKACVSNITVKDVTMHNTINGVRIKTWQGGSGSVRGITFSNIQLSQVQFPIVIDQFYCDRRSCKNQSSAVAVSGIQYQNIRGTYTVQPLRFACSDAYPCVDVTLADIELQPIQGRYHMYEPLCWQTFGEQLTPSVPPIDCLQIGKPASNNLQSDRDSC